MFVLFILFDHHSLNFLFLTLKSCIILEIYCPFPKASKKQLLDIIDDDN